MMLKPKYLRILLLVTGVFLLLVNHAEAQCAMCRAVVSEGVGAGDESGALIGAGINKGILYLMGIPYILLFLLFHSRIISFFREYRQLYQTSDKAAGSVE